MRERTRKKAKNMKKIVLIFALIVLSMNSASATYYRTTTGNCNNVMSKLDSAVATHRAVITEVSCNRHVARPIPRHYEANKRFIKREVHAYRPVVKYVPVMTVVNVEQDCCGCCCSC